jgi:hypothetical protein
LTVQNVSDPSQGTITATGFSIINDHEVTWILPKRFNGNREDNRVRIACG